ncbi:MAG: UDP-N-acetylmuramate dehydrogenase [Bacteroidales bacterium]
MAFCVENGWGGLENLSLIPGQAGSSPIQNIGAYGVELKDHFHSLRACCKETGKVMTFNREDCGFAYRSSFFKGKGKDRYIILSVTFGLDRNPVIRTDYGGLQGELKSMGCSHPDIADVRAAVCRIRESKLPDPEVTGNAGSFFKNPVVPKETYHQLKNKHPGIVAFTESNGMKLAAGWLIDQAGWKGYREGDAGVHPKQALVLINHGKASGIDILNLASRIQDSVRERFGVKLEPEVNIV